MAWTTPRDWQTSDMLTADLMNEQLRDNLAYLRNPGTLHYVEHDGSYSTTSSSFVDVDNTNLRLNLTTNGGPLLVGMQAFVRTSTFSDDDSHGRSIQFDIALDGARQGGTHGLLHYNPTGFETNGFHLTGHLPIPTSFQTLLPVLAAGTYEIDLQWRAYAGHFGRQAYMVNSSGGGGATLFYALELTV